VRTTARARPARRVACRDQRGSGAAAVIIFSFVFLALAAFVIDGGLSISQRERAADIAEQAARYAAEDINEADLRSNGDVVIDYADCDARVRQFAAESGLTPTDVAASGCTRADAQEVTVEIQLTYRPVLTGILYDHSLKVHGTAQADPLTG
jgi:Flp pilus assembly protein TadG